MNQIKTQQEDLAQLHFDLENEDETKYMLSYFLMSNCICKFILIPVEYLV